MNAPTNPKELQLQTVEFKLDGQTIVSYEGETILKAAKRHGIDIPHLCFKDGYRADGNCPVSYTHLTLPTNREV